jgi:hypothetical protein
MTKLRDWGDERLEELRAHLMENHEAEKRNMRAWSASQVEELRGFLTEQLDRERERAEAAERALDDRPTLPPGGPTASRLYRRLRRLAGKCYRRARKVLGEARRAVRRARGRLSGLGSRRS